MSAPKKINFQESEMGVEVEKLLRDMVLNAAYHTAASYSANSTTYPNNLIPFVDKHMNYLQAHPKTDPQHYMANLRLSTRLK
jgi:hypothetical protein